MIDLGKNFGVSLTESEAAKISRICVIEKTIVERPARKGWLGIFDDKPALTRKGYYVYIQFLGMFSGIQGETVTSREEAEDIRTKTQNILESALAIPGK